VLGLIMVAGASVFAVAKAPTDGSESLLAEEGGTQAGWCEGKGRHPGHRLEMMAEVLDLTDEQRKQIKEIVASEREAVKPLTRQLREKHKELRAATQGGAFDEAAVRSLAAGQAGIFTELIVAKARVTSRIFAVLTPEQKAKAEKIRPLWEGRRGHRRGFGGFPG
jgi:Spy/CpxP family protein refolding chaperone